MQADVQRRNLAMQYLDNLKRANANLDAELDKEAASATRESLRRILSSIPKHLLADAALQPRYIRTRHKLAPTSMAVLANGWVFSGAKDGSISAWQLQISSSNDTPASLTPVFKYFIPGAPQIRMKTCEKTFKHEISRVKVNRHPFSEVATKHKLHEAFQPGHYGAITSIAASDDGHYIASAGVDCLVNIRDAVTGSSLFTILLGNEAEGLGIAGDRLIIGEALVLRVYSIQDRIELFTLHGHTAGITNCAPADPASSECCITSSKDTSIRYFDFYRQSQLIFPCPSIVEDCVALSPDLFLGCGSDGVYLITRKRKKPISIRHPLASQDGAPGVCLDNVDYCRRVVTCIHAIPGSDTFVTGIFGRVTLWTTENDDLRIVRSIPVEGFVNALRVVELMGELVIVACVGQYPAHSRMDYCREGKNALVVISIHVGSRVPEDALTGDPVVRRFRKH